MTPDRARVLYWTDGFIPDSGGVSVRANELLPALRDRGHELRVIASHHGPGLPDREVVDGIPVHRFRFWQTLDGADIESLLRIRSAIERLKAEHRPDLVHIDFVGPATFFHLQTRAETSVPTLVTMQQDGALRTSVEDSLLARVFRIADRVAFCSEHLRQAVTERLPELKARSVVIHNAVKIAEGLPAPLPTASPVLVSAGRLERDKGFDLALRAMGRVRNTHPDARLLLAGDGGERERLEELARDLDLGDRVRFLGRIPRADVMRRLEAATAVIVPSRKEAFGLTALEASAAGRPVVATRVGGLPEVVTDGETGILVEPDDPDSLAAGVTRLLENPETARRMGGAARRRAEERFEWTGHVDAYDHIYRELSSRRQRC